MTQTPQRAAALTQEEVGEFMAARSSPGVDGGERLEPTSTATTFRVRDVGALTTDGPLAETEEVLGGFFLVEADNLDDVIEIAAKTSTARSGSVEVRPIGGRP